MEDELKCSYCNDFYCNPVLLPCSHSLCYACALNLQEKFSNQTTNSNINLQKNTKTKHSNATLNSNCSTLTHTSNDISNNITTAILNAAKSASQMVALSNPNNVSPTSISPHSSISSSSSINIDNICRRTSSTTDLGSSIVSDLDKLSIFSETDSGMVAFHNSTSSANQSIMTASSINQTRPSSYLSNQSTSSSSSSSSSISPVNDLKTKQKVSFPLHSPAPSHLTPTPLPIFQTTPLYSTYFPCPQCNRMIYMDDSGVESLTRNTCLENIVERYTESKKLTLKCQMCPPASILSKQNSDQPVSQKSEKDAVYMCEQCEIYYCEECRELCHPMRGPLQKHSMVAAKYGRDLIRRKNRQKESKCSDHPTENVNSYCLLCKCVCCSQCANETVHINHEIQQINTFCKSQKVCNYFLFYIKNNLKL
jgi:tripartite motif-containing protein 9/67